MEQKLIDMFVDVIAEHNEQLQKLGDALDSIVNTQEMIARNLQAIYDRLPKADITK